MVRTLSGTGTDRMEALSDGLFAIVLTLLMDGYRSAYKS
jgi:uncharacterized membrane protein